MTPFSCIGPVLPPGGGGAPRVDSFQVLVPVMASVPLKRQPRSPRMDAPVAVMEPSQTVALLSPTPRITR